MRQATPRLPRRDAGSDGGNASWSFRQLSVVPETLITFAHRLVASAISVAKSDGDPVATVPPKPAIHDAISGSTRTALISRLSRATASAGVLRGAPMPNHVLAW